MNPEERDLRLQLLDRFALCVDMRGIAKVQQRVEILERRLAYESDPEGFCEAWSAHEEQLSQEIARARQLLAAISFSQENLLAIVQLTTSFRVDGHRADIVILKAALALAAWAGRPSIARQDILLAAELALPHRLKRQPFEEATLDAGEIEDRLHRATPLAVSDPALPRDGTSTAVQATAKRELTR